MKRGYRKIINILKKADPRTFYQGGLNNFHYDQGRMIVPSGEQRFCSMGIVLNKMGFNWQDWWDGKIGFQQWVTENLGLTEEDVRFVTDLNDRQCNSYQCVAEQMEKNLS